MAHLRTDVQDGVAVQGRKPYGWGDDRLAAFLNLASVLGTFAQLRDEYDRLRRIDDAFVDFTDNLLNPQDPIAPLLMLQAHASYRAAAELALTCQSAPAFMAMRGCLESSLYGFYFHRNPNTFEMWVRRHDDDAARQAVRAEFTIRRWKDCLTPVDPATAKSVADLYDKTIDFGAHPNVAALAGAFRAENNDQRRQFKVIYLTAGSSDDPRHDEIGRSDRRGEPPDLQERLPGALRPAWDYGTAHGAASGPLTGRS